MRSSNGGQGLGFKKSEYQPPNDERPYQEFVIFVSLPGTDEKKFEQICKVFNFREEV